MVTMRAQWPHTVDDIVKSLDGIWGLVGAEGSSGDLYRLERSLHEPLVYTLTEYQGGDESKVVRKQTYNAGDKDKAVADFAAAIGL